MFIDGRVLVILFAITITLLIGLFFQFNQPTYKECFDAQVEKWEKELGEGYDFMTRSLASDHCDKYRKKD